MITKEFIEKNIPVKTPTMPVNYIRSNDKGNRSNNDNNMTSVLIRLRDKYCLEQDNHTLQLLSFTGAARAFGYDRQAVQDFILKNISIASDSSKANKSELEKMINDNYTRYIVGEFANNYYSTKTDNKPYEYTATLSGEDCKSYLEKYEQYRITSSSNYPVPESFVALGGASIATHGNIMAISGLQKQGKSHLCNMILAGCLGDTIDGVPEEFKIKKSEGKAVIHFDTEQAKHHHVRNITNAILKRAHLDKDPVYFYSYNVKGMGTNEANKMLEEICAAANSACGGIHVLAIDGAADFINSVNNEDESNAIVKHLEQLATFYNMLVIVVIHLNPNGEKARGHLGSQLLRKCEANIVIKKDGDNFYIDPAELRTAAKGDIPKYLFAYNKDKGYPCYAGISQKQEKPNIKERNANFVAAEMQDGVTYKRKDLVKMISDNMTLSAESAEKIVGNMVDEKIIILTKRGQYQKFVESPQQEIEFEAAPF